MRRLLQRHVLARPWVALAVMVVSFLVFGTATLNLFYELHANVELLREHGWLAAMEGGLLQLAELTATGALALLAWLLFKACELSLVQWITRKED